MKKIILLASLISSLSFASTNDDTTQIANKLKAIQPENFSNVRIEPSLMDGFYQVIFKNGAKVYVDKDVTRFVKGDLIKVENNNLMNVTEQETRIRNSKIIGDLVSKYENSLVKYPAKKEKIASLYVFSDFTCPYCKKLHDNMTQINEIGIEINYIPFPKNSMEDTRVVKGLQRIMCDKDRNSAFNEAFTNPKKYALESVNLDLTCPEAVDILSFHNYADLLGIRGTPTMYTKNGSKIVGFTTAKDFALSLRKALDEELIWKDKGNQ